MTVFVYPQESPIKNLLGAGIAVDGEVFQVPYHLVEAAVTNLGSLPPGLQVAHTMGHTQMTLDALLKGLAYAEKLGLTAGSIKELIQKTKRVKLIDMLDPADGSYTEGIVWDENDFEAVEEPISDDEPGIVAIVLKNVSFNDFLAPESQAPRGAASDALVYFGERGTEWSREPGLPCHTICRHLFEDALGSAAFDLDNPPAIVEHMADTEISNPIKDYIRDSVPPEHLVVAYGSGVVAIKQEITARLELVEGVSSKHLPRVDWTRFGNVHKVLGTDRPAKETAGAAKTLIDRLLKPSDLTNILDESFLKALDTRVGELVPILDEKKGLGLSDRVAEILKRDEELRTDRKHSAPALAKADAGPYVSFFKDPKALQVLETNDAFRTTNLQVAAHATERNYIAFWSALALATAKGLPLLPKVLAAGAANLPHSHELYRRIKDMYPYLSQYLGACLAEDRDGEPLERLKGYEAPAQALKLLFKADLYGLFCFAIKSGLAHRHNAAFPNLPVRPELKTMPELTGEILDQAAEWLTTLTSAIGYESSERGFSHVLGNAKEILRDTPVSLAGDAQTRAAKYIKQACTEGATRLEVAIKSHSQAYFDPVLFRDMPLADHMIKEHREALSQVALLGKYVVGMLHATNKRDYPDRPPKAEPKRAKPGPKPAPTTTGSRPANRHFEHLGSGPGWLEVLTTNKGDGEMWRNRFDLKKIAADIGCGVKDRAWRYCLALNGYENFAESPKEPARHVRPTNDKIRLYSSGQFCKRTRYTP